jgi:DNA invertase Pin-like site-specific DNA recombinase
MPAPEPKNVKTWEARKERFNEMFSMCLEGKTLLEVGKQYGISKQAVSSFLHNNANEKELELLQESFAKRVASVWFKPRVISKLEEGLTCAQISKDIDCHVSTVKRISSQWRKSNTQVS